ncbi:hypothetical protein CKO27_21055 [Thiocystis violacea]|nr:hypothetical protein [Thiocystis violacea]
MPLFPTAGHLKLFGASLVLLLAGCSAVEPRPEDVPRLADPASPPVTRLTSFSDALACMDDLFARSGAKTRLVTALSLPDQTGKNIGGGTRTMLISTISEMNRRSNAFRFVDIPQTFSGVTPNPETSRIDVDYLNAMPDGLTIDWPDYILEASVSELDQGVSSTSAGGGLDLGQVGGGISRERQVSAMTIDFNVKVGKTMKIINGAGSTNSVALVNRGKGLDLDARLKTVGGYFTLSVDRAEGQHAALRSLIQLSTIEVLGKLAGVPYQQCLSQSRTPSGTLTRTGVPALKITGARDGYQVGDKLEVRVRASRRTDLFCYYQNARGQIWQVLPTRFQPNASVAADDTIRIPDTTQFDLVFDAPGSEQVMCLGVPPGIADSLSAKLGRFSRADLQPLQVRSLDEVEGTFRAVIRVPEDLVRSDLSVRVN